MNEAESSRNTTTKEALLGMLSLGAMSGYEIRQRIEGSIGNFWQESYGQIYPTLKRLVAEGLAEVKPERRGLAASGGGGAGRTVYRLTAAGRKRLRTWLSEPSALQVPRNELLLRIFFASEGGGAVMVREQVEAFREVHAGALRRYGEIRKGIEREHGNRPEAAFWLMTLEYGVAQTEAMLRWCEKTLETVKRMEEVRYAS